LPKIKTITNRKTFDFLNLTTYKTI